jgi:hypothetical protein
MVNAKQITVAVAHHFGLRTSIIVPNVSWGLGLHECDVLVVRPSGYAIEVEIKVSRSDLLADAKKTHGHRSEKISELWFAVPEKLHSCVNDIPDHAGMLLYTGNPRCWFDIAKEAKRNKNARRLTDAEKMKVAHLGCMRWPGLMMKLIAYNERRYGS